VALGNINPARTADGRSRESMVRAGTAVRRFRAQRVSLQGKPKARAVTRSGLGDDPGLLAAKPAAGCYFTNA
jgi:hypothetical protein